MAAVVWGSGFHAVYAGCCCIGAVGGGSCPVKAGAAPVMPLMSASSPLLMGRAASLYPAPYLGCALSFVGSCVTPPAVSGSASTFQAFFFEIFWNLEKFQISKKFQKFEKKIIPTIPKNSKKFAVSMGRNSPERLHRGTPTRASILRSRRHAPASTRTPSGHFHDATGRVPECLYTGYALAGHQGPVPLALGFLGIGAGPVLVRGAEALPASTTGGGGGGGGRCAGGRRGRTRHKEVGGSGRGTRTAFVRVAPLAVPVFCVQTRRGRSM